MLKISKLTDYATGILSHMARSTEQSYTARDLMLQTHINLPTVMKLLKQLTKAQLLVSHRGSNGGYSLAKAPSAIPLIEIIEAIEGQIALTECSLKASQCSLELLCNTRDNWQTISQLLQVALQQITLADMARPLTMQPFQIKLADKTFTTELQANSGV